ncbi:MAG TPA: hypothetical protein VJ964_00140 [Balneolaceae bacterium]|nr:hypothetical protein [Balneolaceae bacterium]
MEQRSIDLVELFKFCYHQYKKYASFVIGAMVTLYVLAFVPQVYFFLRAPKTPTQKTDIISVILTVVQLFLTLGFTKIMFLLVQDAYVEVADMFNNFRTFLSFFVASILYNIAVLLGLFLLIAPGIFIAIRFQFYPYFIIEQGDHSFAALQKSYYLSQDLTLELLLFGIAIVVLNIVGVLLIGIGIIFTYPLTTMATAVVYKGLTEEANIIPTDAFRV